MVDESVHTKMVNDSDDVRESEDFKDEMFGEVPAKEVPDVEWGRAKSSSMEQWFYATAIVLTPAEDEME